MVNASAAELGYTKDQRAHLGRWLPEQSDDYLRSARILVFEIQAAVAAALRSESPKVSEEEVLDKLEDHMQTRSASTQRCEEVCSSLDWRKLRLAELDQPRAVEHLAEEIQDFAEDPLEQELPVIEDGEAEEAPVLEAEEEALAVIEVSSDSDETMRPASKRSAIGSTSL